MRCPGVVHRVVAGLVRRRHWLCRGRLRPRHTAGRSLEARGVEPLSLQPLPQASTCLASREFSGFCCELARYSHPSVHEIDSSAGAVTPPANQPAVVASWPQQASGRKRRGYLSRESEIFVIRIYVLIRGFNEANESSSTCGLGIKLKVETSTPPFRRI